ncbi:MAG: UDP-forming cellulose synthase catalytic subunit [Halothiobacillaceae bacterium]|nr:UDP-forming cellulose synthase catalytic subunit [Halothiobacillaceae bacterium]
MFPLPSALHDTWKRVQASLPALAYSELLLWSALFVFFMYAASAPLTTATQATLAWSLVLVLYLFQANFERIERHAGPYLKLIRIVIIFLAVFITLRYIIWRMTNTISYHDPFSLLGALLLLGAELYGIGIYFLGAFVNAFPIHRTPAPLPDDPNQWPTVDILVPSYNEDAEMLEITLMAATQIRYPKHRFKVYLCDDGGTVQRRNRPDITEQSWARFHELNALCERVGAIYVTREKNLHAKAGNLNSALQDYCHGELVLILDADHVPTTDFLENTVGFFLQDPKLFLVQTPHHFINPDPVERNLRTYDHMPSENEMFYSIIQHGLDFWGASFFCGSAAVLRRSHIDLVGGVAGETITEDAETAMGLHGLGYHSVYFGKPMVAGLQPETFSGFTIQRMRWAQGMVQIFLLKNPWTQPNMGVEQRIAYTASVFFWFFPVARATFLIVPGLYLIFGLKIYDATLEQFMAYALPHVLAAILLSNVLYGKTRWPFISELYETVQALFSLPAIIEVIKSPRSPSFAVTPKGETLNDDFISQLVMPFYVLLGLNIIFVIAGGIRLIFLPEQTDVIIITLIWTGINLIFLFAAIGVMLEKAQRRAANRIQTRDIISQCQLEIAGKMQTATMLNVSHSGAALLVDRKIRSNTELVLHVDLPGLGRTSCIPARTVSMRAHNNSLDKQVLAIEFEPTTQNEKREIVALMYGSSDLYDINQRSRQHRVNPLEGLLYLLRTASYHAWEHVIHLHIMAWQMLKSAINARLQVLQRHAREIQRVMFK